MSCEPIILLSLLENKVLQKDKIKRDGFNNLCFEHFFIDLILHQISRKDKENENLEMAKVETLYLFRRIT